MSDSLITREAKEHLVHSRNEEDQSPQDSQVKMPPPPRTGYKLEKDRYFSFLHFRQPYIKYIVLFFIANAVLGSYYTYDAPAVVATEIMASLKITNAQFGLLYSVYSFPNIFFPLLGGYVIDKIGIRTSLMVFLGLITMGSVISFFSVVIFEDRWAYLGLLFGRFIYGAGSEASFVGIDSFAYIYFKGKLLSFALGVTNAACQIGEILSWSTMALFSEKLGNWRYAMIFPALLCAWSMLAGYTACGYDWKTERDMQRSGIKRLKGETYSPTWRDIKNFPRGYWLCVATFIPFYVVIYPFMSYASDFLQTKWDYNSVQAARLASSISLVAAITSPVVGILMDKYGKKIYAVLVGMTLSIFALYKMAYTQSDPAIPFILMGVAYSVIPGAIYPAIALLVDEHVFATAYGLNLAVGNLGTVILYWFLGKLIDDSNKITSSLGLLAIIACIGLFIAGLWLLEDLKTGSPCNRRPSQTTPTVKSEVE